MVEFKAPETVLLKPNITIVGVGGAGGNAVNNMIGAGLQGANFVVANTDAQALDNSLCQNRVQLGAAITKGLGAGASPEIGEQAAKESEVEIRGQLEGSHMVFITCGLGGGTGTGAAPVIAKIAKEMGILTVGVVTKPFHFEGVQRMKTSERGVIELQKDVDTLVVIPNQNLFRVVNEETTFAEAFKIADDVLHAGVRGVTDLIIMPGLINLDFADIRSVMKQMGKAMMGTGEASGEGRAVKAAEAAISNPLLDNSSMRGAKGVLINITGGQDMTLYEVDAAANRIIEEVGDSDANIIFGSAYNAELKGYIRVSVVATGIGNSELPGKVAEVIKIEEKIVKEEHDDASLSELVDAVYPAVFDNYIGNSKPEVSKIEVVPIAHATMSITPENLSKTEKRQGVLGKVWNSLMLRQEKHTTVTAPVVKQAVEESVPHNSSLDNKAEIHEIPTFLRKQR